jgi:putative aldouronate transport system substrate-binding protein
MCAVAADTEYPEICVRWLDYRYSKEGALLINYGVEGKSYDMVDGEPAYKQEILDLQPTDPQKLTWYISGDTVGLVYYQRMWQGANEEALKAYDVWAKDPTDKVLPKITLTAEEASASSAKMADIDTYINESISMFITGQKSLEEFDAFVEQIKSMGIDEVIKINQDALDRYNAR